MAAVLLGVLIASCGATPTFAPGLPAASATAATPTLAEEVAQVDPRDRQCVEQTLSALVNGVNRADEPRLDEILRSASFGLSGQAATGPDDAVTQLLSRSRSGERWTLVSMQVSGRGWDGNVHFSVRLQRSGPGLPQPYADQAGKGSLDCPAGRVSILFIG